MTLNPSDEGIVFCKGDCKSPAVSATIANVLDTVHGTSIGSGEASFRMVEHLLGTLYAHGIDGVRIVVERGDELPILDGSALPIVQALRETDTVRREAVAPSTALVVDEPFHYTHKGSILAVYPATRLGISYFISYRQYPELTQQKTVAVDPAGFDAEIAPARTYAFLEWIEPLQKQGLIKGGSLENSLVYGKDGFINPGPLRFNDELVRHKILDFLGDLSLFGQRITGHFVIICGGHTSHVAFLNALKQRISCADQSCGTGKRDTG